MHGWLGRGIAPGDGFEVVEWMARQEWSDGKVGMIGFSAGAFLAIEEVRLEGVSPIGRKLPGYVSRRSLAANRFVVLHPLPL